jgi:glutamate decarboxylase
VTLDAHKQLYVPVGAGMVVFKDVAALSAVEHHASYVLRHGSRDIGKHTLEGTRQGMAMLVHSALCIIGRRGYELLIGLSLDKARQFAAMIRQSGDFELTSEPVLSLLTYRYLPVAAQAALARGSAEERVAINLTLDALNESIQKEQRAGGKTFVSRTRLETAAYAGQVLSVLRVVLAKPLTTPEILREILEEQRALGERLVVEEGHRFG